MNDRPRDAAPAQTGGFPVLAVLLLTAGIFACSIYANLSFAITDSADYRFFPPFQPYVNANMNRHLGAEYYNMGRSLVMGEGFSHPFDAPTGPTAWQPPVLPGILAALLYVCGRRDAVMTVVVFLQVYVFIGTGVLVLLLIRQTTTRIAGIVAAAIFFLWLVNDFALCFQFTHDSWLVLLAIDLLIAGFCWLRPLAYGETAAGWGLFGGLGTLVNPSVGFAWALFTLRLGARERAWGRFGVALLVAVLTLTPWTIRNYLVFGRWIPIKPNLAFELYQSQCLQSEGLLNGSTFALHPYHANTRERQEYERLGETAYLDKKREQFWQAVRADPWDYVQRVGSRLVGAMLWYVPFYRDQETRRPWVVWISRVFHPLPFIALVLLLASARRQPLHWEQWTVICVYLLYLLPYVVASYYERYALPLIGLKVLLVLWGADRLLWFLTARCKDNAV